MSRQRALLERYTQARADVDASDAEIRRASATRLAELLACADRTALIAGVRDPALTAYDCQQLQYAIADRLPRRGRPKASTNLGCVFALSLRRARYRWRAVAWLATFALQMTPAGFLAWHNTATEEVVFSQPWEFVWHFPDGGVQTFSISAGAAVVVMHGSQPGLITLRLWHRSSHL